MAIFAIIFVLFTGAKRELAPQEDLGYVFVSSKAPQYANVDYTARYSNQISSIFCSMPEFLQSWNASGGRRATNVAFGGIVLKDWSRRERDSQAIQAELNARIRNLTGIRATAFQQSALPAASKGLPVQMLIRSPDDFSALYKTMGQIKGTAWKSGLFVYVDSDLAFDSPEASVTIDRDKACEMGVSMSQIAETLALMVGENYVNRFNFYDRSYDVITQVYREERTSPDNLGQFYVRTDSGKLVSLATVVNIATRPQANTLTQFNQMNSATMSAVLAPGVTMGQAVDFLKKQKLPPGTSVDWLADSRQFVKEGNRLTVSFGFALVVIFLVLAAQFESFRDPLVILVTVPLAVCGALAPLYLNFTTLNIYTQIGLVTLIGLISKHGILMVSFANQMQREEKLSPPEAISHAAVVRMRPILMTTAAMVAGLLPLLYASGAGAAGRFAIGIVVVMGLLVGTLFTLFVLPAIYSLVAADHRWAADDNAGRTGQEVFHA